MGRINGILLWNTKKEMSWPKSREQEDAFIVVMILVNCDRLSQQGTFCLFQRSSSDNRVPNILDLIQEK